jgi:hypothetical protein
MTQEVIRQHPTVETQVRTSISSLGICGEQSSTGTDISPSSSVFLCQYHSTMALHTRVLPGVWTTGPLSAVVQRHSLTPMTWTTKSSLNHSIYLQNCITPLWWVSVHNTATTDKDLLRFTKSVKNQCITSVIKIVILLSSYWEHGDNEMVNVMLVPVCYRSIPASTWVLEYH